MLNQDGLPTPRRYYATLAIMATLVLVVLDGAIANVALPTLATAMRVPPAASIWVVNGYQLALVMTLLPCAALGESFGLRRVFIGGVAVFTAASLLCAVSPSLHWLVAARFVQGVGGAAVLALGIGLIRFTYPQRLLGSIIGWNATVIALSAAAGPMIGAAILSVASWPWLFAVNLPVGAIVLLLARALPQPPSTGRPIDRTSAALDAVGFAALVLGIKRITTAPARAAALLRVAIAGFAMLVRREGARPAPLIPLDLLRAHPFRISVIASVFCFAGQMASYVALPFYLQHTRGHGDLATGLLMTPWPLVVAVVGPLSGWLADRMPNGLLCAAGGAALSAGLAIAAALPPGGSLFSFEACLMLAGLGFGLFQTPNNRNMLLSAPKERSGAVGGAQATARLLGQTIGSVIMVLLFTVADTTTAPRIGLAVSATLALAGGLVSALRIRATSNLEPTDLARPDLGSRPSPCCTVGLRHPGTTCPLPTKRTTLFLTMAAETFRGGRPGRRQTPSVTEAAPTGTARITEDPASPRSRPPTAGRLPADVAGRASPEWARSSRHRIPLMWSA